MPEKKNWFARHKVLTVIGVVILIGIVAGAAGGESTPSNSNTDQTTQEEAKPETQTQTKPEEKKISLDELYAQIENGQTKEEVTALAGGREPSSCTESQDEYVGKTEYCSYGNFTDGGMISVIFTNDKVSNKTKSDF